MKPDSAFRKALIAAIAVWLANRPHDRAPIWGQYLIYPSNLGTKEETAAIQGKRYRVTIDLEDCPE